MTEEQETPDARGVSITLKGGTGYDAPWIVIREGSVPAARAHLMELRLSDLIEGVSTVARSFHAAYSGANPASTQFAGTPQQVQAAQPASTPPPAFVDNQQAQPAGWGNQQPAQQVQQQLGATVMGQFPNHLAVCPTHNAQREFFGPGTSRTTNKPYGASLRCQVQGCKPVWANKDGSWPAQ